MGARPIAMWDVAMREDCFHRPCHDQRRDDAPGSSRWERGEREEGPGTAQPRRGRAGVAPDAARGSRPELALDPVRGDRFTRSCEEALPWHEVFERQEERLRNEACRLGLPTEWQPPTEACAMPGGAEHHLWRGKDGRVYKMTKEDHFGQVPCYNPDSLTGWENLAAAPADYLARLALMNQVFGDDIRLVGLRCGRTVAIVTSQPLAKAARAQRPHPADGRKIETYMAGRGFVNLGFAAWYHPQQKLMVTDATPDNFIRTRQGLTPVDLMICRAEDELRDVLEKKVASGQPNDELRMRFW
jgi:hypothetical protein